MPGPSFEESQVAFNKTRLQVLHFFTPLLAAGAVCYFLVSAAIFIGGRNCGAAYIASLGILALVGAASLAAGGGLGFLFGLPRSTTRPRIDDDKKLESDPKIRATAFEINNNLSDVSDWLTKILIGASLASVGSLFSVFKELIALIGKALEKVGYESPFGQAVAGLIIAYYAILGFIFSYNLTVLWIFKAYNEAIDIARRPFDNIRDIATIAVENAMPTDDAESPDKVQRQPSTADAKVIEQVRSTNKNSLVSSNDFYLWGRAQATVQNYGDAIWALTTALDLDPKNSEIAVSLAATYRAARQFDEAFDFLKAYLDQMSAGGDVSRQIAEHNVLRIKRALILSSLYTGKKANLEYAIEIGASVVSQSTRARIQRVVLRHLAAAAGQLHKLSKGQDVEQMTYREKALDFVRQALEKAKSDEVIPGSRAVEEEINWFRHMMDPKNRDNDLSSLKGDPDLRKLVGLPLL